MLAPARWKFLGSAIAAWLLAGCSTGPGPVAPGVGTSAPPESGIASPLSAPSRVTNPLPAGTLDRDPCRALTPGQLTNLLGATTLGEPSDSGIARTCSWANNDRGSLITIQFVYIWRDGLGHVYANRDAGFFKEMDPVQGFPVVAYGPDDERSIGRCGVAIGVADNAAFEADATISRSNVGKTDACDAARRIGDAVVTTLKGVA
ncbi:DUF3558 domain-containing protein [Amycolatopsis sp. PS_44_ISF1]|uniref:DUF3558 domain-containing protein n=1 Tax=Amycolatopsis sp. PS_44_ISF1 TaxID=2974917 RepID=UPI0028DDC389|nr:DUF3558 domain-containing protein [Amycolatopsis sp. PS_44_ISF1]MDT8915853.1 DUF3558 domain-containing protein [Amycolatopsis sp. PS_44_ISF1]